MIEYFTKLNKSSSCNVIDTLTPENMKKNDTWEVKKSSLTSSDIERLEDELHVKFTDDYKEFIGCCAHLFSVLKGKLDNFLYEDDVDVTLKIVPQPYENEILYLKDELLENKMMLEMGYLPIGEFNDNGYLYIDKNKDNKIVWLPFEDCVGYTSYEEFDSEGFIIFDNFKELMECFFEGKVHEIAD